MGKDPFEDPELQAMRASMRPAAGQVRWGRVLTGVLVVACATFAVAYYLPLRRAHETLAARFAELQSKVDAANRAVEESRGRVEELGEKTQTLQSQLDGVAQREKARVEAGRALKSALEGQLQKPIGGGQAAVAVVDGRVMASLSLGYLLARGKLELSPPGKVALCGIASTSSKHAIRVVAIAGKKDIPGAVALKLKTPLEYNLAVAALVTRTLADSCKASPTQLSATGVPAEPAASSQLDGKKLAGPRIELWLEPAE